MKAKDAVTKLASGPRGATTDADPSSDDEVETGTEGEEREAVEPLPLDAVFELLKNKRRRNTIDYLRNTDGEVTLSDLAEHVAAIENDTTIQALTSDERKRAYVGLYQCHLPKMDEMNAVDFNRDRGIIELGPNAVQLEPYLDLNEDERDRNWPAYYLALSGGGLVLLGLSLVAGSSVGFTAGIACFFTVVAFAGLAVAHSVAEPSDSG